MSEPILCEVRCKDGKVKRILTTWSWFINYGYPYVVAVLMY